MEVSGECVKCAAGTYSYKYGAQKCEPCPNSYTASNARTTCVDVPEVASNDASTAATTGCTSCTYTVIVFALFLLVTAFALSQLDDIMQDQSSHMKVLLLGLILIVGKVLGDSDGWLLAYSAVFRIGEVPSWYGAVANTAVIRLIAGASVALLYGSWAVLVLEGIWFALLVMGDKKVLPFPATQKP